MTDLIPFSKRYKYLFIDRHANEEKFDKFDKRDALVGEEFPHDEET